MILIMSIVQSSLKDGDFGHGGNKPIIRVFSFDEKLLNHGRGRTLRF